MSCLCDGSPHEKDPRKDLNARQWWGLIDD